METAFFFASGLLLVGFVLRARLRLFQVLYIPASVLGGLLGLALVSAIGLYLGSHEAANATTDTTLSGIDVWFNHLQTDTLPQLKSWPGWLIAIVFAGLFLNHPKQSMRVGLKQALREGIMVWIIGLGQIGLGLLVTWLFLSRVFDVPAYFGQLIEIGFIGGHGTAAAVGQVYQETQETINFADGADLAMVFATLGLIYSVISGIVLINIGLRKGWTRGGNIQIPRLTGLEARHDPQPIAFGRVRGEVIDPLVFQCLILVVVMLIGMAMQWVISGENQLTQSIGLYQYTKNFPLFMYTLLAGLMVRQCMVYWKLLDLLDPPGIARLCAGAMEFLIVAAITTLNVQAVMQHWQPIVILLLIGCVWSGFCLVVLSKQLLPKHHWFELGLINYGMSTGTTAQGLMLLRIIDKDMDCGAAEDFALGAPLSAPFIGGGMLTMTLPLILAGAHVAWVVGCCLAGVVGLYWLGLKLNRGIAEKK